MGSATSVEFVWSCYFAVPVTTFWGFGCVSLIFDVLLQH